MLFNPPRSGALRAYLILAVGQAFAFALAYTLQGLYFVQAAHLTPFQLLLIGSVLEGSAFVLEVPTGVIADVYSRRLSIVLGCLCLGLAMLLVGSFPVFGVIVGAQVVSAAGYTFLSGAQEAWLADELGEERLGGRLLLGGQYGRLAGVAGILGAAALARLGLGAPMLAGGVCLLSLGAFLAWRMPERGFTPLPPGERQSWAALSATLRGGLRAVRASRVLGLLLGAALLYGASHEAQDRLGEYHLLLDTGLPGGFAPATTLAVLSLAGLLLGLVVTEPLR